MTKKKQAIIERRRWIAQAYEADRHREAISVLVAAWAKKYKITEATVYTDLRVHTGGSKRRNKGVEA